MLACPKGGNSLGYPGFWCSFPKELDQKEAVGICNMVVIMFVQIV